LDQIKSQRNDNLKILAMITMLIDHLGHMRLLPEAWYTVSRTIGRIAFPIFAYQIAVGFDKTSSRKRYAVRLLVFALIAQVPYTWFNPQLEKQLLHFNILFLLLAGVGVLQLYENAKASWHRYGTTRQKSQILIAGSYGILTLLAIALPEVIDIYLLKRGIEFSFEYSSYGLAMILFFHCFRHSSWKTTVSYGILSMLGVLLTTLWVAVKYGQQITGNEVLYVDALRNWDLLKSIMTRNQVHLSLQGVWFQVRSLLAIPCIFLLEAYRGKIQIHLPRAVGYWFYPAHIALLVLWKYFLGL